ncbi:MAG: mechanosensitive ion channel [Candidatus Tenebribacter davisii]|nr:mechanosensitive ion channel [Candidatus Tenebribacter davisii]
MNIETFQDLLNLTIIQTYLVMAATAFILAFLLYFITKNIFLRIIIKVSKKTKTLWDDKLVERKVFHKLSYIVPLVVIYYSATLFPAFTTIIQRLAKAGMCWFAILAVSALLLAVNDIYLTTRRAKEKPIKSYLQIINIFFFIMGFIIILGTLLGRSPWVFVSGLGAMTAVLLLIFKDTILSLIASMQITINNLIEIGDWLSVPQFNADGNVIDIALHTVKIQNWDKTISVIPTYKLMEGTFKNWRGMQESGGRRIKRAINLDITSIRFCDDAMMQKFERFELLKPYLAAKKKELAEYNSHHNTEELINGRNLTNIGTLRAYIQAYLHNHPRINNEMTFLIRQLESGASGLPIEIYVFTDEKAWANYEAIQADIFDHILAVVPEFGLKIFQYPTDLGFDLKKLGMQE